jgi:hypothetical protein
MAAHSPLWLVLFVRPHEVALARGSTGELAEVATAVFPLAGVATEQQFKLIEQSSVFDAPSRQVCRAFGSRCRHIRRRSFLTSRSAFGPLKKRSRGAGDPQLMTMIFLALKSASSIHSPAAFQAAGAFLGLTFPQRRLLPIRRRRRAI